jgi:Flp pilus assembly protein TadG
MLRRRNNQERGAAAVEFALVAIVFLTLICGVIQASLFFWGYDVASHAAREGARRYAVDPCNLSGQNVTITESRAIGAASTPVGVSASFAKGPGNSAATKEAGDQVTVTVSFSAKSIGGLIPAFPAITKSATARVEDVENCS